MTDTSAEAARLNEERSYRAGQRDARLLQHDAQFTLLRVDLAELRTQVTELRTATELLAAGARSSADTAVALAKALKEEKDTARETLVAEQTTKAQNSETRWTPYSRFVTVGGLIISTFGAWYLATH